MWGSERRLDDYLRGRLDRALEELARIDPDVILSENVDVVVAVLVGKHMPTELEVDWDSGTRTPVTEVTTQVRDQFHPDEIYTVPASRVVVSNPISGTTEMLDYQASRISIGGKHGKISGAVVIVEVVERVLNADTILRQVDRVKQDVDQRVDWANGDLAKFTVTAEEAIRNNVARRKERILNDRQVEGALGIPVRTSGTPRPPVPARRKHITLQTRTGQTGFVPEPVLEEAIFHDVLDGVRAWATSLERTPRTAAKLDEEELRDLLLGNLNTYWQGGAGGELFNGSGKTDILIRHGNRNAKMADEYRVLVHLAAAAGLRQGGEAFGLTVSRVNFLRREVTIDRQLLRAKGDAPVFGPPKTKKSHRVIPVPADLVEALAAHIAEYSTGPEGLVFTSPYGGALKVTTFNSGPWAAAVEKSKAPQGMTFHWLRHHYASRLIRFGESVKTVQARLGHATAAETLDTYGHLWPDSDDRTREAASGAVAGKVADSVADSAAES